MRLCYRQPRETHTDGTGSYTALRPRPLLFFSAPKLPVLERSDHSGTRGWAVRLPLSPRAGLCNKCGLGTAFGTHIVPMAIIAAATSGTEGHVLLQSLLLRRPLKPGSLWVRRHREICGQASAPGLGPRPPRFPPSPDSTLVLRTISVQLPCGARAP